MPDRITKTQRWLDLIAYLVGRRMPVTVSELMEKVPAYRRKWVGGSDTDRATVRRMFERDKDELRELGVPLESVPQPAAEEWEVQEAYKLATRDFFLPYLKVIGGPGVRAKPVGSSAIGEVELAREALTTSLDALRFAEAVPGFPYAAEARSALRKLALDAPPEAKPSPEVPVLFLDSAGAQDVVQRVRVLSEALLARKRVRFRYHGIQRGVATDRDVAPYGLMFQHGHWYLVGEDALRQDIRVFRVERMEPPSANRQKPKSPDYEIPDNFKLREHLRREPWELGEAGEVVKALVSFRFPSSLWAARNEHGELVREEPDGAAVRAFDVKDVGPFLRWILSLEGDAVILQPPELRQALRADAERVAAAHGSGGGRAPSAPAAGGSGGGRPGRRGPSGEVPGA